MLDSTQADIDRDTRPVLLCFSHLRWDFVFQRPQHLLRRAAETMRVLYWEEAAGHDAPPCVKRRLTPEGVLVLQPFLTNHTPDDPPVLRRLLDETLASLGVRDPVLWYYTPQALLFSDHLCGRPTVYDCMDELSAFKGADTALPALEQALLRRADLVFTGGASLFEAKRALHADVHCFPSGVDTAHFYPARAGLPEPPDLAGIPHPRLGYYGVIDERLDLDLLAGLAALRPGTQFVLVGPVAKIDPAALPRAANLHYLGAKTYAELPAYAAHWDVALMPFALNESTRFISPTKTPEYLAAGLPVVSTPIVDVVRQYGDVPGVQIASDAAGFATAVDRALALQPESWRGEADRVLDGMSWDATWSRMAGLIAARRRPPAPRHAALSTGAYDVLVVGAGFAGAVLAERLAAGSGLRVLVVDRRPHIGGNAYDCLDAAGVLIHPYGPHIFHTNAQSVVDYLSRFTAWRPYEHRVLARVGGQTLPMPINRTTINRFFGVDLSEAEIAPFLAARAEPPETIRTSADVVLAAVGRELYEAFFQGYTRKQWGLDPSALDKSVTARVPTRTNDDDRYFLDRFQQMPLHGYTRMFERMLDHPGITVMTGTAFQDVDAGAYRHLVFTGPVDEFFGHRYGKLPYRSLRFEHTTLDQEWHQSVGVVNEPAESVPFTRVTEFKHLTGQRHPKTSLCYEYPTAEGDPFYPVPTAENAELYRRYQALADARPDVSFVGRLATYKYYNMDQVVAQALATYDRLAVRLAVPERVAAE